MQDKILDVALFAFSLGLLPLVLHFAIKQSPLRLSLLGLRINTLVAMLVILASLVVATTAGPALHEKFDGSIWTGTMLILAIGVTGAALIHGPMLLWLAVELHLAAVGTFQRSAEAPALANRTARWLRRTWVMHWLLCQMRGLNPKQVLEYFQRTTASDSRPTINRP